MQTPDAPDAAAPAIDDLAARLERERRDADRAYNEALTALDRALQHAATLPSAPRAFDDTLMPALNERWQVAQPGAPVRRGPLGGARPGARHPRPASAAT